jgi:hypothetical protein
MDRRAGRVGLGKAASLQKQVAVDRHRHVLGPHRGISEDRREGTTGGTVVSIDIGVVAHPRVQQHQPLG